MTFDFTKQGLDLISSVIGMLALVFFIHQGNEADPFPLEVVFSGSFFAFEMPNYLIFLVARTLHGQIFGSF